MGPGAARAEAVDAQVAAAARMYFDGRAVSARTALIRLLDGAEARDPSTRMVAMTTLLDICLHSYADACVLEYGPQYAALAKAAPTANTALAQQQALRAGYYLDAARLRLGQPQVTAAVLEGEAWRHEIAYDGVLYLRRRMLAADVRLAQGKPAEALREADRILSLLASLKNPQDARFEVAYALNDVIGTLMEAGQTERAYGLYRAGGPFIREALGSRSVDAAVFRLAEARVLEGVGDVGGASRALGEAAEIVGGIELDDDTREWLLGPTLSLRAVACALQSDMVCARQAVGAHPAAPFYRSSGRAPASTEDLSYLVARALVSALDGARDDVAAAALSGPLGFTPDRSVSKSVAVLQAAGRALALPAGPERLAAITELGRNLHAAAEGAETEVAGDWYRPGVVDQLLTVIALTGASQPHAPAAADADAETTFVLFQLAGRAGPSFDADALSVLAQARDPLQRRAIHEVLRLRARRDRLEREMVAAVAQRATREPVTGLAILSHDIPGRGVLRDYARRLDRAQTELASGGVRLSGANLTSVQQLQQRLRLDEAALITAPAPGGLVYMCVRRDATFRTIAPVDVARVRLDTRLLQTALSATYAPSEELDGQFPAEAAVRLHAALIRPFEPCLRPGDRIVWLPGVASLGGVPLAALLSQVPPRMGEGYDLSRADWLVRGHAVSYAGSASAVVAARGGARPASPFAFLGVGDPVLTGETEDGQARGRAVLRGVRGGSAFGDLAPLPETRDELQASAAGFRDPRLLLADEATEGRFRAELVGGYGLISFATHGLLREDLQGLTEPALVLTPVSTRDPQDDGLLTASEIADLNLTAGFVALSACNTANFDLSQAAEDLPALASAFAVAGTPSTLATLWPVNSETGKRVVADTFARLSGGGPAEALAAAQRAFLADPPGRAYLHPRFWAPFVILGDAAPPGRNDSGLNVTSVEALSTGGEGLSVRRGARGTVARFIGDHAAGVSLRTDAAPAWRQELPGRGASPFTADLGGRLVAAGYEKTAAEPIVAGLQAFEPRTGALLEVWRDEPRGADFSAILAGAATGPERAVVAVADVVRRDGERPSVRVLSLDGRLSPRLLFETSGPEGLTIDAATVTPMRGDLMLTFTARYAPLAAAPAEGLDDWDAPLCASEPVTWIELRDGRTGALKAAREVRGLDVNSAIAQGGRVLLGGGVKTGCAEESRAVVQAVDLRLQTRTLYEDPTLGESWVWSLSAMNRGRIFVAASKRSVVDFRRAEAAPPAAGRGPIGASGMVLTLDRDGRASEPRLLESGGDVFVNGADATLGHDILLAGALGGRAVVFHLALEAPARR